MNPEFPKLTNKWFADNDNAKFREIDEIFNRIDENATEHQTQLSRNYMLQINIAPINVFTGLQIYSHTASELLRGLMMYWEARNLPENERLFLAMRQGLVSQVTAICRQTFVEIISLIEFVTTQAISKLPEVFVPPTKKEKVYLYKTINKSADIGWIPLEHKETWSGLLELRNALVHRNGISDKTVSYKITELHTLVFEDGKPIGGHINGIAKLCEWAEEAVFKWSESCVKTLRR